MNRAIANTFREKTEVLIRRAKINEMPMVESRVRYSQQAKALAWAIFLIFFIENDTLGLFPKQFYMVYRNVRISDLIIYGTIIYSLLNIREFQKLYNSKLLIIVKLFLIYLLFQFVLSVILYEVNPIEYFFRLKGIWSSFMIFPFLLLLKRNGFEYLIKLIFPVSIVSNILYILTAITGIALLPGLEIVKQSLPGDLQINRVFGGTFYGEYFFLGFIFLWITKKFKPYQLILAAFFVTPHILSFGRGAWANLVFAVLFIVVWNLLRKRNFKLFLKQTLILALLGVVIIYGFIRFIPESDYLFEAIGSRVSQGEEDVKYKEGTYGTRLSNIDALISLWKSTNIFFGIGMHPMWVVKPETYEETIYAWGFTDVRWTSVLCAYGLVGFSMAIAFQIIFFIASLRIMKNNTNIDIQTFFIILLCEGLFFDTVIGFSTSMFSTSLWGYFMSTAFATAVCINKWEEMKEPKQPLMNESINVIKA